MAYVISGACISCGSCAGECPVGAIAEGDGKYEINADACVDCGTCAGGCPVGAISLGLSPGDTYKRIKPARTSRLFS